MPTLNWIGKEGETLDRHDRWLSMMYPRRALSKNFLRDDGTIFISIDDNDVGNLQALLRERKVKWRRKKPGVGDVLDRYDSLRGEYGDDHAKNRRR